MTEDLFLVVFFIALTVETCWGIFLTRRNITWIKSKSGVVPEYLKGKTTEEELAKAATYSAAKGNVHIIESLFSTILLIVAIVIGFLGTVDNWYAGYENEYIRMSLFYGTLLLIQFVLGIPFSLYSSFVIEERFGFNKLTPGMFVSDSLKGLIISIALMTPLLAALVWFISNFTLWWLYSWLMLFLFSLLMMWIYPSFIAPMFNKFSPLPEGDLSDELNNLAEKTDFSFKEVKVMDASKRSKHSNAYFTGFGKVKQIVLFDTLLKSSSKEEIVSVLAHELGHFKMRHTLKGLAVSQVFMLTGFFVMNFFMDVDFLYTSLGLNKNNWSVLLCFGLIIPRFTFWISPFSGWFSRKNEFEADKYAKDIVGTGEHLISALITLGKENLSSPEPYPLYHKWNYSHPTVGQRVEALNRSSLKVN